MRVCLPNCLSLNYGVDSTPWMARTSVRLTRGASSKRTKSDARGNWDVRILTVRLQVALRRCIRVRLGRGVRVPGRKAHAPGHVVLEPPNEEPDWRDKGQRCDRQRS